MNKFAMYFSQLKFYISELLGFNFQDSASPPMEELEELHNNIMYYLAIILFTVTWMMITIIKNFVYKKSKISHKYMNHDRLIALIFFIAPVVILFIIAFPTLKLYYLMDDSIFTLVSIHADGGSNTWTWIPEHPENDGYGVSSSESSSGDDDMTDASAGEDEGSSGDDDMTDASAGEDEGSSGDEDGGVYMTAADAAELRANFIAAFPADQINYWDQAYEVRNRDAAGLNEALHDCIEMLDNSKSEDEISYWENLLNEIREEIAIRDQESNE